MNTGTIAVEMIVKTIEKLPVQINPGRLQRIPVKSLAGFRSH